MKTYLTPLRSNMGSFQNIAKEKKPWGLRDIMRDLEIKKKLEEKRLEIRNEREKLLSSGPNTRFTLVKRIKGGGFHCTGIGDVKVESFDGLKKFVREFKTEEGKSFNRIRMGAITATL